jgi:hypothetical protein
MLTVFSIQVRDLCTEVTHLPVCAQNTFRFALIAVKIPQQQMYLMKMSYDQNKSM